jgi:hypothetical protein
MCNFPAALNAGRQKSLMMMISAESNKNGAAARHVTIDALMNDSRTGTDVTADPSESTTSPNYNIRHKKFDSRRQKSKM